MAVGVLYAVLGRGGSSGAQGTGSRGNYPYTVGTPGPGDVAPAIDLESTGGGTFRLADSLGEERVLLFFQEGLTCQPCWDQAVALQRDAAKLRGLGIEQIVSITTDPLELVAQKAGDEGIELPVLSDPTGAVSDTYGARGFGMMGGERNGHTFVLVDEDGTIAWRADYGGEPNFFMFIPDEVILSELRSALGASG